MKRATGEAKGDWLWRVLACPRCNGRLKPAQNLVRCSACGPYPLLGDVPILVPDPAGWCATFHDAVLAALAQHGLATREAVHVVGAFAQGRLEEAQRFGDDWTSHEVSGEDAPHPVRGPALATLLQLRRAGLDDGPTTWLEKHSRAVDLALEVGCGAGVRSELLSAHARQLVVGDLSLRAVLHARARASRGLGAVAGVVLDAGALPVAKGALDLLVAENLVDLVDEPLVFLEAVRDCLGKRGRALVTTPDPSLGSGDDGALKQVAVAAKLKVSEVRDGLPWLRVNSARHVEVYLVQALALARADARR
jgi:SAM-dependent methyltransferase